MSNNKDFIALIAAFGGMTDEELSDVNKYKNAINQFNQMRQDDKADNSSK